MTVSSALPAWVTLLGFLAGVLGIGIAIYLQFFVTKQVRAINIVLFFGTGVAAFLLAVRSDTVGPDIYIALRALGFALLLVLEIVGFGEVTWKIRNGGDDTAV